MTFWEYEIHEDIVSLPRSDDLLCLNNSHDFAHVSHLWIKTKKQP